jgi:anti-sigma-K factor RskA
VNPSHREERERLGAYVLGGLTVDERHAVEHHLVGCPECRDEVSRLSSLPPLLSRLSPEEARDGTLLPSTDLADRLVAEVAAETTALRRQVRRLRRVAAAAAAAAILLAVGLVANLPGAGPDLDPPLVAEVVPIAADAGDTEGTASAYAWEWGTTVELQVSALPPRDRYVVWTLTQDGRREQAGTWGPTADQGAYLRSASAVPRQDLARVEVLDPEGTVLFAFDF